MKKVVSVILSLALILVLCTGCGSTAATTTTATDTAKTDNSDITMPELAEKLAKAKGVKADPSNLSKFLIASGLSFKKNSSGKRTRQA